jgi:hypothetical protein
MKNVKIYKNLFALLSIAIVFTLVLGGCGASGYSNSKSSEMLSSPNRADSGGGNYYEAESYALSSYDYDEESGAEYSLLSAAGATRASLPADRKIIRDANVTMEVENVEKAYDNILASLASFGGYEANRNMQTYNEDDTSVYATFKIPANKLDMFLAGLKNEGKVKNSNISSSDITDAYHDSKIRLDTLEKTLENYYRFLENAVDVDEQLRVTRYINDTTAEIEQIKGILKLWDSLVDYSTITLSLYKTYQAPKEVREIKWNSLSLEDFLYYLGSVFLGVCNGIYYIFAWLLIAIVTLSPIFIPIVVLVLILVYRYNKKKKKKAIQAGQNSQNKSVNPGGNSGEG